MRIYEAITRLEPVHALLMRLDAHKRNELGAKVAKLGGLPSEGIQIEHTEKMFEAFRTVYEYARDHGPNSLVSIDSLQQLLREVCEGAGNRHGGEHVLCGSAGAAGGPRPQGGVKR